MLGPQLQQELSSADHMDTPSKSSVVRETSSRASIPSFLRESRPLSYLRVTSQRSSIPTSRRDSVARRLLYPQTPSRDSFLGRASYFLRDSLKVSRLGCRLSLFDRFIADCGGWECLQGLSTREVCERFLRPMNSGSNSPYCEVMRRQEASFVASANVFVVHSWSYNFLELVTHLKYELGADPEAVVWLDLFSCNQHADHVRDTKGVIKSLRVLMGTMQRVLVVWLDSWKLLSPFKRTWCLYEICCAEEAELAIEIVMDETTMTSFLDEVAANYDAFKALLRGMDMRCSSTTKPEERDVLLKYVEKTHGLVKSSMVVHRAIRKWMINKIETDLVSVPGGHLKYGFVLAVLQHDQVTPPTIEDSDADPSEFLNGDARAVDNSRPLLSSMSRLSTRVMSLFRTKSKPKLPNDADLHDFPLLGLNFHAIEEFIREIGRTTLIDSKSSAVIDNCIKSIINSESSSSYCELLQNTRRKGVGEASVMIIHSSESIFLEVMGLLKEHFDEEANTILWMQEFCLNPYSEEHMSLQWFSKNFEIAIRHLRFTALVLLEWESPIPLRSLLAIYFALTAGKPFELIMNKAKRYNFLFAIATNESVLNYLLINAYMEEEKLCELIPLTNRTNFTNIVKEGILNAMALFFEKHQSSYPPEEQVRITDALGVLYQRTGNIQKAEVQYLTSLQRRRESTNRDEASLKSYVDALASTYRGSLQLVRVDERNGTETKSLRNSSSYKADQRQGEDPILYQTPSKEYPPYHNGEILTGMVDSPFSLRDSLNRFSVRISQGLKSISSARKKTRLHIEHSLPIPSDGISTKLIINFVNDCGRESLIKLSFNDVTEKVVKPLTSDFETSYCEYLKWQGETIEPAVLYVAYSSTHDFLSTVELITQHFSDDSTSLWLPLFSLSPFEEDYMSFEWLVKHVEMSVSNMRGTALVLLSWEKPIPLICLFEVYFFLKAGKSLDIIMDKKKWLGFLIALASNANAINNLLSSLMTSGSDDSVPEESLHSKMHEYIVKNWDLAIFASTIQKAITRWLVTAMAASLTSYEPSKQLKITALLARIFYYEKDYDHAEKMYCYCLELQWKLLGNDSTEPLGTLYSLGCLYRELGNLEKAKRVFEELLERRTKLQGRTHTDTLIAMQSLAAIYKRLAIDEQVPLYEECLELRRKVLGSDHVETISTMERLAEIYLSRQMYGKADDLYAVLFEKRRAQLGIDHRATLAVMSILGDVYFKQDKFEKAEYFYVIVLEKKEASLGLEHAETLVTMVALADLYFKIEKFDKAQSLYSVALDKMKTTYGKDHPKTLATMVSLGDVYVKVGNFDVAEILFNYSYNNSLKTVGKSHPDTLVAMMRLANVYVLQQHFEKAEEMFKFCLKVRKDTLGIDHEDTVQLMYSLGDLYISKKEFDKAEKLYDDYWSNVKNLNPNNSKTLNSMSVLADLYFKRGALDKAELFYTLVVEKRRQNLGDFNVDTLNAIYALGAVYHSKGDISSAEKLYLECAEKRLATLGVAHESTRLSISTLASFYQEQGQYENAEKYFDLLYSEQPMMRY